MTRGHRSAPPGRGQVLDDLRLPHRRSGISGCVLAERLAADAAKRVLLIDKRRHIGGNAYDCYDDTGILIHRYGPHIFHTNSREVFDYLGRFTSWRPYQHRVIASVDGQLVPIPINLDTVNRLYGLSLTPWSSSNFLASVAEPVEKVRTSQDVIVSKVGRDLYEKFFRNYTRKQWGLDPSELDASVTARVPVRTNRDDRYFSDAYQAMPLHGYTKMFERMTAHPNIKVLLNARLSRGERDDRNTGRQSTPARSTSISVIDTESCRTGRWSSISDPSPARVSTRPGREFPNDNAYTRCTEFKYLTGQEHSSTTVVYEYPTDHGDPYYPVPRPENAELSRRYQVLASAPPACTSPDA